MKDEIQIPENILLTLEIEAKQKGKKIDEVIEEYKKIIERNKQTNEIFKIIKKIEELTKQKPSEVIKKAFKIADVKIPNYQYIKASYDYKIIKENDVLIFNMDNTELENGKIYFFNLKLFEKDYFLYAEYNKELNSFVFDEKLKKFLKFDENIKILGILIKIEKEIDPHSSIK